jgi:hypothetical protein
MLYWIGAGVLIFIGFALAPLVVAVAIVALPGIVGAGIGCVLAAVLFKGTEFVVLAAVLFAVGGFGLPYVITGLRENSHLRQGPGANDESGAPHWPHGENGPQWLGRHTSDDRGLYWRQLGRWLRNR